MTDDVIGTGTHQQLITLLTEQGARFSRHGARGGREMRSGK